MKHCNQCGRPEGEVSFRKHCGICVPCTSSKAYAKYHSTEGSGRGEIGVDLELNKLAEFCWKVTASIPAKG